MQLVNQIKQAKDEFSNFSATYQEFNGISTLDWKNRDGTNIYKIRYVFDQGNDCLYISGDVGTCVVHLTECPTLKALSNYINKVDYFCEKVICSDTKLYEYDLAKARKELREENVLLTEEELEPVIENILEGFSSSDGIDKSMGDLCACLDSCYEYWIERIGMYVSTRVILWLVGLNMAYEQLSNNNLQTERSNT